MQHWLKHAGEIGWTFLLRQGLTLGRSFGQALHRKKQRIDLAYMYVHVVEMGRRNPLSFSASEPTDI
jgi:hypothetical protein